MCLPAKYDGRQTVAVTREAVAPSYAGPSARHGHWLEAIAQHVSAPTPKATASDLREQRARVLQWLTVVSRARSSHASGGAGEDVLVHAAAVAEILPGFHVTAFAVA
jgi:hypothetical protein